MVNRADFSRQNLVRIFTTQDELEAGMIQEMLRNAGIESTINAEMVPSVFPLNTGSAGKHEIWVLEGQAKEAQRIIEEEYESGTPKDIPESA